VTVADERVVEPDPLKYPQRGMKKTTQPDVITIAACRWLLSGAEAGCYSGPEPGSMHGLSPLLSGETGMREISLSCAAMWLRLEQTIRPVLKSIAENNTTVWAAKGFDLARSVYPFPGGRPMCDADFFIRKSEYNLVLNEFSRSKWLIVSPGDGVFTSGIVSEIKMIRHEVIAELHTHIFYFPATFPGKLPADLFQGGRLLEPGLMGFAWHNALLIVILHLLTNSSIRPVWWVDITLLCAKVTETDTWELFAKNAFGTMLGNSIASTLEVARKQLEAPVPERVIHTLQNLESSRDVILQQLRRGKKIPTILNLRYLPSWKRIAWLAALFKLLLTNGQPLKTR
jgi:hypothetical protein